MLLNSVYLYPNKVDVYTNYEATWVTERYYRVYNRNLKIYRSVDNRIDFQVRNRDQKAISVDQTYLVFSIFNNITQELVYQKDCTMIADDEERHLKGRAYVVVTADDLLMLERGAYQYSLVQEVRIYNNDTYAVTSRTPTYMDSQYGAIGTLEIVGDLFGDITDSIVIEEFALVNPFTQGDETPKWYESSIINANPQLSTPQSLHTLQLYFNNYQGSVIIQGSIEPQGATPDKWIDIETFTPAKPVEFYNVVGRWNWLRIKHIPTQGSLDKILYR